MSLVNEKPRYLSLSILNVHGLAARTLPIDENLTSLLGPNGVGKTTALLMIWLSQMPDLGLVGLESAGIGEDKTDRGLAGRLKNPSIVALEVRSRKGERLLFVTFIRKLAKEKLELSLLCVHLVDKGIVPLDLLRTRHEENKTIDFHTPQTIKEIALLQGLKVESFSSEADYMAALCEAGLTSRPFNRRPQRGRYAELSRTMLLGGLSKNVLKDLKSYLFPESHSLKDELSNMQQTLAKIRTARYRFEQQQTQLTLFERLLSTAKTLACNAWALSELRFKNIDQEWQARENEIQTLSSAHEETGKKLKDEQNQRELLQTEKQGIDSTINQMQNEKSVLQTLRVQVKQRDLAQTTIDDLEPQMQEVDTQIAALKEEAEKTEKEKSWLEKELQSLINALLSHQQAVDRETERLAKFTSARSHLNEAQQQLSRDLCPDGAEFEADLAEKVIATINQLRQEAVVNKDQKERQLERAQQIRSGWEAAYRLLRAGWKTDLYLADTKVAFDALCKQQNADLKLAHTLSDLSTKKSELETAVSEKEQILSVMKALEISPPDEALEWTELGFRRQLIDDKQTFSNLESRLPELRQQSNQCALSLQHANNQLEAGNKQHNALKKLQPKINQLEPQPEKVMSSYLTQQKQSLELQAEELNLELTQWQKKDEALSKKMAELDDHHHANRLRVLRKLADTVSGTSLPDLLDDEITLEEAPYFEAALGQKSGAILVEDLHQATEALLSSDEERPQDVILIQMDGAQSMVEGYEYSKLQALINEVQYGDRLDDQSEILVAENERQWRLSRFPARPMLGAHARRARREELESQRDEVQSRIDVIEKQLEPVVSQRKLCEGLLMHAETLDRGEPDLDLLQLEVENCQSHKLTIEGLLTETEQKHHRLLHQIQELHQVAPFAHRLDQQPQQVLDTVNQSYQVAKEAHTRSMQQHKWLSQLEPYRQSLMTPYPDDLSQLKKRLGELEQQLKTLALQKDLVQQVIATREYLTYTDAEKNLLDQQVRMTAMTNKQEELSQGKENNEFQMKKLMDSQLSLKEQCSKLVGKKESSIELLNRLNNEIADIENEHGYRFSAFRLKELEEKTPKWLERQTSLGDAIQRRMEVINKLETEFFRQKAQLEEKNKTQSACSEKRTLLLKVREDIATPLIASSYSDDFEPVVQALMQEKKERTLENQISLQRLKFKDIVGQFGIDNPLYEWLNRVNEKDDLGKFGGQIYLKAVELTLNRVNRAWATAQSPDFMLSQLREACQRTTEELQKLEKHFRATGADIAREIEMRMRREIKAANQLNQEIKYLKYGNIDEIKLDVVAIKDRLALLDALASDSKLTQDLFAQEISIEDALAQLYQREFGGKIKGERLLDHREYLSCTAKIKRRNQTLFETVSANNVSTGEGIGTGLALLVAVQRAWARAHHGRKAFNLMVCVDEGSRLDENALGTIHELARQLNTQVIIAAPDMNHPGGTAYRFVRNAEDKLTVIGVRKRTKQADDEATDPLVDQQALIEALNS